MLLNIDKIDFSYYSSKVLNEVTFKAESKEFIGIMGPNGSGKTTLLRCISNVLSPQVGTVLLDGREIHKLSKKEIAKNIGVVPQSSNIDFSFTVSELVLMGRTPHTARFQNETDLDFKIAENAMKLTRTIHLSNRIFDELSGGERQRVIIARALAQEPKILLLDEATVHLDISSKFEILKLIKKIGNEKNIVVIAVFHDLNLAAQYSNKLILIDKGKIVSIGTPDEVLSPENIQKTYHIDAIVKRHSLTNTPYVTPYIFNKQNNNKSSQTVHVICGGGSGSDIMSFLLEKGFKVTTGVLNVLDSDYETAKNLKIQVVGEIPFSQITDNSHKENIRLINKSDYVVVTDFQIGPGNLKNLEAAENALTIKLPVVIINSTPISEKDFIGGNLEQHFNQLLKNKAIFVKNPEEALNYLLEVTK
jgi:iron complex transport system ATP-binding protein